MNDKLIEERERAWDKFGWHEAGEPDPTIEEAFKAGWDAVLSVLSEATPEELRQQIASYIEPVLALNDPPIVARERAGRMSYQILAKVLPAIEALNVENKKLRGILSKAPTQEDIDAMQFRINELAGRVEAAKREGRQEVVQWVSTNSKDALIRDSVPQMFMTGFAKWEWEAKLKEWDLAPQNKETDHEKH